MLRSEMIGPEAIEGEGRRARIRVAIAKQQIAARRHIGQALGNGLMTRVNDAGAELGARSRDEPGSMAYQLMQSRLEAELRRNRIAAREEAEGNARLCLASDAKKALADVIERYQAEIEAMLPELAEGLAEFTGVDEGRLLDIIMSVYERKTAQAAERAKVRAQGDRLGL